MLLCGLSKPANAQSINETFEAAQLLTAEGRTDTAIYLFQKVLFFDVNNTYAAKIYPRLGLSYLINTDFEKAAYYFDLAYYNSDNDVLANQLLLHKAYSLIRLNRFADAVADLLEIIPTEHNQKETWHLLLATAYFGLNEQNESLTHFKHLFADDSLKMSELDLIFDNLSNEKSLNPRKAALLSYFLPGLGQFYARDIGAGINSFLLNGVFVTLGFIVAINYSFLDASFSIGPWLYRYYMGGTKNAERLAIRHNKSLKDKHFRKIHGLLNEQWNVLQIELTP
jgi:tetratricopeptide (TPR) repeat protein